MYCIYYIKNKITNQYYIGQTHNFEERIKKHFKQSKNPDSKITYNINKYGIDNFEYDIIQDNIIDKEEVSKLERYYIEKYNSFLDGYNTTHGGEHNITGIRRTEEQKKNISIATKKAMDNPELKQRLSDFWNEYYKNHEGHTKGKQMSQEAKEKLSKAKKGKPIVFHKSKEELFKKRSSASKRTNSDRHWYTNGEVDVRIKSNDITYYISIGYKKGRSCSNNKNKKHVKNDR